MRPGGPARFAGWPARFAGWPARDAGCRRGRRRYVDGPRADCVSARRGGSPSGVGDTQSVRRNRLKSVADWGMSVRTIAKRLTVRKDILALSHRIHSVVRIRPVAIYLPLRQAGPCPFAVTQGRDSSQAQNDRLSRYSRMSRRRLERLGWRSFFMALASIWRMRSRVTPHSRPTSSNVRAVPSVSP